MSASLKWQSKYKHSMLNMRAL